MLKNILVLISIWNLVPSHGLYYDINNIYNGSDVSIEFLSRFIKESSNNSQSNFSKEESSLKGRRATNAEKYNWDRFYDWNVTYSWMCSLVFKYPDIVYIEDGGTTFENRKIFGVEISHDRYTPRPIIFIEAGMIGNDWIGSSAATFIINQLLNPPNERIRDLAQSFDWIIFPHVNVDGVIYSHSYKYNHNWVKSRSRYGEACLGVNLNRNWGYHWDAIQEVDSSSCSITYKGKHAFSEKETKSFANYLNIYKRKQLQMYISLHSGGQLILYPFGCHPEKPENLADYNKIVEAGIKGFGSRYGTEYTGGSIYDSFFPFSGSSVDWVYGFEISPLAFQIQLSTPVVYKFGYNINEDQIIPICEETMDGIESMIYKAKELGYFNINGPDDL